MSLLLDRQIRKTIIRGHNTPLLDIKPYVSHFDSRENVKNGWLEKHFKNGKIPMRTKLS